MPLPNTPPSPGKDKQIIRDKEMAKDEDMANEEEEVKDKGLVKDEEIEAAGQQTDNEDDDKAPCPEPEREKLSISDTVRLDPSLSALLRFANVSTPASSTSACTSNPWTICTQSTPAAPALPTMSPGST